MKTRFMTNKRRTRRGKAPSFALWLTGALLALLLGGLAGRATQQSSQAPSSAAPWRPGTVGLASVTTPTPAPSTPSAASGSSPSQPPGLDGTQAKILARLGHPGKALLVSIAHQTIYIYQGDTLVNWSYVTTGRPHLDTPRGTFSILRREHAITFHSPWPPGNPYYYSPIFINYALLFRNGGFFLHDYSQRHYYGPGTNIWHQNPDGTWETGSHGCVEAPLAFLRWVYTWGAVGTPFVVY